jgi:hypothetical protein
MLSSDRPFESAGDWTSTQLAHAANAEQAESREHDATDDTDDDEGPPPDAA